MRFKRSANKDIFADAINREIRKVRNAHKQFRFALRYKDPSSLQQNECPKRRMILGECSGS